jgi:hypothetical protein
MSIVSSAVNFMWKNATLETVGKVLLVNYLISSIGGALYVGKMAVDLTCLVGRVVYMPAKYLLSSPPKQDVLMIEYEEEITVAELTERIVQQTLKPGVKFRVVEEGK